MVNFLQKPSGALVLLATAIGGPYAAFETDIGVIARRFISETVLENDQPSSALPQSLESPPSLGVGYPGNSNAYDPTFAMMQPSPIQPAQIQPGGLEAAVSNPYFPTVGSTTVSPNSNAAPFNPGMVAGGYPNPNGNSGIPGVPAGYLTSVSTPVAIDPSTGYPLNAPLAVSGNNNPAAVNGPPIIESHRGSSGLVPGDTGQLWANTIGVPSLQQLATQPQQLGGGEVHDLREVLRFDIHPGWLPQRFARVTTVLSNVQLDGLRVPLVTGTKPSDLAGTLTYYFDSTKTLQRINLHGLTGDPSQIANLMNQFYGLRPEQSLGGQLFTNRWNNRVSSVLHIAPAPIMYAGADHSKYIVFLELNQTSANFALSEEAASFLQGIQSTQRW